MTAPLEHFSVLPFQAICGADEPNQLSTQVAAHVTCQDCKRRLEQTMSPEPLTEKALDEIELGLAEITARTYVGAPLSIELASKVVADLRAVRAVVRDLAILVEAGIESDHLPPLGQKGIGQFLDRNWLARARSVLPPEDQ